MAIWGYSWVCVLAAEIDRVVLPLKDFRPLIGGILSNGASKYPYLFGYTIFEDNPYFLPCLMSSLLTFIGVLLGSAFLEEVLCLFAS